MLGALHTVIVSFFIKCDFFSRYTHIVDSPATFWVPFFAPSKIPVTVVRINKFRRGGFRETRKPA